MIERFEGTPYRDHGRDYSGIDCYGLVYLFYRDVLKKHIPTLSAEYGAADEVELKEARKNINFGQWEEIQGKPKFGDVGLFAANGRFHVGVCVDDRGRKILHILKNHTATIEDIARATWKKRFKGWYRYVG